MRLRLLPLLPLLTLLLVHCSSDEQSLGTDQGDSSHAGTGGSSGAAGGTSTISRRICDGSDGLTLSYTNRGGGMFDTGIYVQYEIGTGFFVDGHCQYWVTPPGVDPYFGNPLYPTRTGTLTAAQEQQLATDLGYDQWPQFYGLSPGSSSPDKGAVLAMDRTGAFSCWALCGSNQADSEAFFSRISQWEGDLYTQGTATSTPMRARAVEVDDEQATQLSAVLLPWTLSVPLASLLSTGDDFHGDAPLIDDADDLSKLRAIRDTMRTIRTETPGKSVYVEQTTPLLRAQLYLRDTIPLENEHGLIPAP